MDNSVPGFVHFRGGLIVSSDVFELDAIYNLLYVRQNFRKFSYVADVIL